uniref:Uncharacterized protein n=1 Tax=Rhizophora mucronata TaxID=61149 RepID=A0A2P2KL21_RHIMU
MDFLCPLRSSQMYWSLTCVGKTMYPFYGSSLRRLWCSRSCLLSWFLLCSLTGLFHIAIPSLLRTGFIWNSLRDTLLSLRVKLMAQTMRRS